MKQAIIITIKNKEIDKIRKKYDPYHKKVEGHITLIYSFQKFNQKELYKHIRNSLKDYKKFSVILNTLKKSKKEYYLYLLIKEKETIIRLRKKLNSKIFSENKRMGKYIPHLTLGVFKNKRDIDDALNHLKRERINIKFKINSIQLRTLTKDDEIKSTKNFMLK
ncbi:MAG TPA: 2'-5' RNA ligase family protein [Candidatus Pacearchaeota archaeon]|nr:2'-5' RNA ligase family protein [Candidatus Pacearchaeota archaeon]